MYDQPKIDGDRFSSDYKPLADIGTQAVNTAVNSGRAVASVISTASGKAPGIWGNSLTPARTATDELPFSSPQGGIHPTLSNALFKPGMAALENRTASVPQSSPLSAAPRPWKSSSSGDSEASKGPMLPGLARTASKVASAIPKIAKVAEVAAAFL